MKYDVFICHASEDKDDFVRPLAEKLISQHIQVWYDEFSLSIGDSLMHKIDEGLTSSKFGIVVLSPNFFMKPWAKRELSGLTAREMYEKRSLILPIWHRIGLSEVLEFSPAMADKRAASSADGINTVLREIANKVKPNESPLLIARDILLGYGLNPPPLSDEWWLDIVEYKEFLKFPDLNAGKRWIFPLPFPNDERGNQRGHNIASTSLQIDWSFDGEELDISPITHPEVVHEYLRRWPGLMECAMLNPEVLALYVPQITIPGFDVGFEAIFDELLDPENNKSDQIGTYTNPSTINGAPPLCGNVIAFRHPNFGNYTPRELARYYFTGYSLDYIRSHLNVFQGLIWLLSNSSDWLPQKYREILIEGILDDSYWFSLAMQYDNSESFLTEVENKKSRKVRFSMEALQSLEKIVNKTLGELGIIQDVATIVDRLLELEPAKRYRNCQDRLKRNRRR
ncbi:toll/interleukin-1 receptor domain-containing protein [Chitinophaga caseinilytica]|uniref:toll/interleukin-1 receptor domain-containing protein n=1 Tax=Chitinophaga caseinilytica TaxID=2267521 RepID=UPI003C2CAD27